MASAIILFLQHVAFLLIRKVLQFALPLPLFPAVSSVLAKAVGIDPLALKPFTLPNVLGLPQIAIIPPSPHILPRVGPTMDMKVPTLGPLQVAAEEATIPLGEKIHTWRQNQLLAHAAEIPMGSLTMEEFAKKKKTRIDQVDFGVDPPAAVSEMAEVVQTMNVFPFREN
jgi:hypothetical protein